VFGHDARSPATFAPLIFGSASGGSIAAVTITFFVATVGRQGVGCESFIQRRQVKVIVNLI
jgi:hypothetical protein